MKTTTRWNDKHLSFDIWCGIYYILYGTSSTRTDNMPAPMHQAYIHETRVYILWNVLYNYQIIACPLQCIAFITPSSTVTCYKFYDSCTSSLCTHWNGTWECVGRNFNRWSLSFYWVGLNLVNECESVYECSCLKHTSCFLKLYCVHMISIPNIYIKPRNRCCVLRDADTSLSSLVDKVLKLIWASSVSHWTVAY